MKQPKKEFSAQEFTLRNTAGKDVKFRGWKLAEVSTFNPDAIDRVRNVVAGSNRWKERAVYQTEGGRIVCHKLGCSAVPGEVNRGEVLVVSTEADVQREFRKTAEEHAALARAGYRDHPDQLQRVERELATTLADAAARPMKAIPVEEQIKAFFVKDPLAKDLLEQLGIEDVETIS